MAILNIYEMPRSGNHKLGEGPVYVRTFKVEVSNASHSFGEIVSACGVTHGSPHPESPIAVVNDLEVSEAIEEQAANADGSLGRFIVNVTATYGVPEREGPQQNPLNRPDIWKFTTQGVAVPALYYYDGTTLKPLTNSAGDYFEGLSVDEAQQKITITSHRASFPSSIAAAITNCVNNSSYLGFAQDCVKVQGISGEEVFELVDDVGWWYWKVTTELLARQTGWNLLVPDVGFNFVEGGVKKRAYVTGPDGDRIASANPVALDGSGGLQAGDTLPAILTRRVYKRIDFGSYFGSSPS